MSGRLVGVLLLLSLTPLTSCIGWKIQAEAYQRATNVQDSAVENLRASAVKYLFEVAKGECREAIREGEDGEAMQGVEDVLDRTRAALLDLRTVEEQEAGVPYHPGLEDWYVDYVRASGLMDDMALRAILRWRGWLGDLHSVMREYGYGAEVEEKDPPEADSPEENPFPDNVRVLGWNGRETVDITRR